MRSWIRAALALALLAPLGALADNELSAWAQLDARAGVVTDVTLDHGHEHGGLAGGSRLRLHADWETHPSLTLTAELDLDGFDLFAATPEVEEIGWSDPYGGFGGHALRADPRFVYLTHTSMIGQLRVGQMGSDWGLGLVANSGSRRPHWGVSRHGDLVERVVFATRPAVWFTGATWAEKTFLAVGGDLVYRDENASLLEGDLALQGVASLLYRERAGEKELGVYVAYRDQTDRPDEVGLESKLQVLATDLYGAWAWHFGEDLQVSVKGELAYLHGFTSRLRTDVAPEGVDIRALGWAVLPELEYAPAGLSFGFWAGYASGDADAEDDRLTRMRFDPEFRPSVVLFEEVLALTSARWAVRARDPAHVNVPPAGSQYLATTGSVSGASFFGPQLRWESHFVEGLELKAGLLFARATAPLIDPYGTFAAGGEPVNLFETPATEQNLGVELDIAARWTHHLMKHLELAIEMEYGHLFPGAAFELAEGRMAPVASTWIGAELAWHFGGEE
ncbi:MAG: hypothetical protein P1V51_23515 [Deltaproteobacteria bacterium]|nr:hypothetical protein [Deltaproteobacteria bacterium]